MTKQIRKKNLPSAQPKRATNNPVFNLKVPMARDYDKTPCQQNDPEIWFPSGETLPEDIEKISLAKSLCSQCHDSTRCLSFAVTNRIRYGIWGGTTEDERHKLIRRAERIKSK
jgi:WhiB family redox-sensing transcriptional regulator